MNTLEDALTLGRGVERPFRCPVHEDRNASASVNVAKGVWFCHSCHASGKVDDKRVPTVQELQSLLEPERAVRRYPESWLTTFGLGGYWSDRFPEWVCWFEGFGTDPWSGEGTYPVYTRSGTLAGVCRRSVSDEGPKYRYPRTWSASQQLSRPTRVNFIGEVLVLVEGKADEAALWECGIPAAACYGAGVHLPQLEHIASLNPKVIVMGFDSDEAGMRAAENTEAMVGADCPWVDWSEHGANDPADLEPGARAQAVLSSVSGQPYGLKGTQLVSQWAVTRQTIERDYVEETRGD